MSHFLSKGLFLSHPLYVRLYAADIQSISRRMESIIPSVFKKDEKMKMTGQKDVVWIIFVINSTRVYVYRRPSVGIQRNCVDWENF